jgi:hypothetical protein
MRKFSSRTNKSITNIHEIKPIIITNKQMKQTTITANDYILNDFNLAAHIAIENKSNSLTLTNMLICTLLFIDISQFASIHSNKQTLQQQSSTQQSHDRHQLTFITNAASATMS